MQANVAHQEQRRQDRILLVLAVALLASQAFSDFLTRNALGIATLWPTNALLAGGLLVLNPRRRVVLIVIAAVSHLAIDLMVGDSLGHAILYTLVDVGEALLVWWVVRRFFGPPRVRTMRQLALLTTLTAPVILAMATLAATVLALTYGLPFVTVLTDWFVCGVLGMAIVLPAVLVLLDSEHRRAFHRPLLEQLGLALLAAALSALVFHRKGLPVPFMLFPIALLTAFRLGPRGAAQTSLIVACVAIPLTVHGLWNSQIQTDWSQAHQNRLVQVFVGVLFVTSLAAGLALAQQERLRRLLMRREQLTRAARARALAANEAKTEFLATMSHEIRTPLNSMLGFSQLLVERRDLAPDVRRQLTLIDSAGTALLTVVNDILDFSRVEAGQVELLFQPTSAAAVLHDAVGIIRPEAENKGLALEVDVVDPVGGLHDLDGLRLRQVLLNLLNNAVKFTEAGRIRACLTIEPGELEDRLKFEIVDTGVGIAVERQGRLFQRFSQVDSSASRPYGGAGLGLAISKALVELMGGKIGFDSAPGHGSAFWLELQAPQVEPYDVGEPQPVAAPGAARILLVDDHPMNREIGAALLSLVGCQVETADNGEQAVAKAARGGFDIILMDIHMPQMDGLAATRAIRALDGEAGEVPIIAMSADALPQQVERCYAAGMVDHVAKPVQREVLYAKVSRWLARR
ncbi:ATP-binding protein [Caulobacter rhizosphaerae]|jgi:signal transduction histidine kinase|uniref:histidine kinase n=1 Tax=Caulobacter rhizosphaerae TaxID=2010972 RepID=A0ABU1N480_9CAUL|nr:ATP-binding protein [Caulobacter rhizosphaerae]MDR6533253.1 signal transduction histidine kinase [Caulobacter rhizosphaerae]GGL08486.1 histidine kinase [Caulobacter rhizosphaerae]